jgi:hypothetical protein
MKTIAKAAAAAATALGTGIITAAQSDGINGNEWWTILGGTLIAGAAVWAVPNAG